MSYEIKENLSSSVFRYYTNDGDIYWQNFTLALGMNYCKMVLKYSLFVY